MNTIQIKANICGTIIERNSSKGTFHTFNIVEPLPFGKVQYYSCVCYDKEIIKNVEGIKSGSKLLVLGELKLNKYKKNDVEHTAVNIVVGSILPLDEFGRYIKSSLPTEQTDAEEITTDDDLPF